MKFIHLRENGKINNFKYNCIFEDGTPNAREVSRLEGNYVKFGSVRRDLGEVQNYIS